MQPTAEEVVPAIAVETRTPADPVSEIKPTRELRYEARHQFVTVAEHANGNEADRRSRAK
jgi:hypothetical protein